MNKYVNACETVYVPDTLCSSIRYCATTVCCEDVTRNCEHCGSEYGHWQEDPYESDLHGDNTLHVICDECCVKLAQEL